eukprot:TRINITY_DN65717_c0_g1_i1.p1 TRINITY_DN65717_c0_g1~~TRINITY_DN65717_c0_g1_i1.p1  ORF type:complete len:211 (+),score=49.64 TRINITY_DN65717_c0_g1_i1:105-737(+)
MDIEPMFLEALSKIFSGWTLMNLAVEQGWGGRDSRSKCAQFKDEVVQRLVAGSRKKRPPCHTNQDDLQELADFLYERIFDLFNCEADDSSDTEVAGLCLRLFNTCRAGDVSFAQQFLQTCPSGPVDLSKCQGIDRTEFATEEDQLLNGLQDMDLDMGIEEEGSDSDEDCMYESMGGKSGADAAAEPSKRQEPEVDEDGFVSVVKGHRRPR